MPKSQVKHWEAKKKEYLEEKYGVDWKDFWEKQG